MALERKPKAFWRRTKKEQEASISMHIGKFLDKLTMDDYLKFSMFLVATWFSKELDLLHAQPIWQEPTPEQEVKNWLANSLVGYIVIYKPEAILAAIRGLTGLIF